METNKPMKIVLVRAPFIGTDTGAPIGLAYLQEALRDTLNKSHPAFAYGYSRLDQYCQQIMKLKPDIVGFSLSYSTVDFSTAMAKKLKHEGIRLIAGGPEATYRATDLIESGIFDSIVLGYGEEAVKRAICESGIIEIPLDREKEYLPGYRGIEFKHYGGRIPIITTRGCPNSCKFCTQHLKYYCHSIDSVVKQIVATPRRCKIIFNDSNLNVNVKRTKKLFSRVGEVIGDRCIHTFGMQVDTRFNEYMDEYSRCNFDEVRLGIESGSLKLRKEMGKPFFTNEAAREMIKNMTSCGTKVWVQFIFCYPSETDEDREETLHLMKEIAKENPTEKIEIYWYRFVVHHGTEQLFKDQYGVFTRTIMDWSNEIYSPKVVEQIANTIKPRLPLSARLFL
jgi:radical SAM superfamily enzyme YgiQ (UPF0313 family)